MRALVATLVTLAALAVTASASVGCSRAEPKLEHTRVLSSATPVPSTDMPPPPAPTATERGSVAAMLPDCPSAAPGAQTFVEDAPGGVALLVLANGDGEPKEIRARAVRLVADARQTTRRHSHDGTGGGHGACPAVLRDTTIAFGEVAGGVRVTVKANDASDVDWLRRETRARAEGLATLALVGGPRMASCPSAVRGATTTVEPTSDGVMVKVTAQSPDAIGLVRTRARRAVHEIAQRDATALPSGVEPQLGGACPIVLDADGARAREIPGGMEVRLQTHGVRVAGLQREAAVRARKLSRAR